MAESKSKTMTFKEIASINVSDHVDKKKSGSQELSYLSWPWAISEASEIDANWTYRILEFGLDGMPVEAGLPYQKVEGGYIVHTEVTLNGQTKRMWLPIMDSHNCAMKDHPYQVTTEYSTFTVPPVDSMAINKTIMRCLVKNLGMFGLGLYLYAGEDLPEGEDVTVVDSTPKKEVTKTEPVEKGNEVEMPFNEALSYCFEQGGKSLQGTPVLKLVTDSKSPEKSMTILEKFANQGTGKDKLACKAILDGLAQGKIKFPDNSVVEDVDIEDVTA